MKKNPLFSIIIPVYSCENFISKCIESVQKQTFNNFEIIIVNDGSTDSCPSIINSFKSMDSRMRIINQENQGVAVARKNGLHIARGEYIVFVDSDDWLDINCLNLLSEVIKKTNADLICHGMMVDNGKVVSPSFITQRAGFYSKDQIRNEIFPCLIQSKTASYFSPSLCGKAIRTEIICKVIMTDNRVKIGEDGASVIPCVYYSNSMYIMTECLYYYRYNSLSATKSKKVFDWEWPMLVAEHLEKNINMDESDFRDQLNRKITHDCYVVLMSQFNSKEKYRQIKRNILKNLSRESYDIAIKQSKFSGSILAVAMQIALKKRLIFPFYLLHQMRK